MYSKHVPLTLAGISTIAKRNPISPPKGALRHQLSVLLLLLVGALVAMAQDPGLPLTNREHQKVWTSPAPHTTSRT